MAFGQQVAYRVQETKVHVAANAWVPLEASAAFPAESGATTPLGNRFAIKVYVTGSGGASRLALSYDNTIPLKDGKQWLGLAEVMVEPCSTGLTLYGCAKPAAGVNSLRIMVTEYGH